jgi:hypothetical protein
MATNQKNSKQSAPPNPRSNSQKPDKASGSDVGAKPAEQGAAASGKSEKVKASPSKQSAGASARR